MEKNGNKVKKLTPQRKPISRQDPLWKKKRIDPDNESMRPTSDQ